MVVMATAAILNNIANFQIAKTFLPLGQLFLTWLKGRYTSSLQIVLIRFLINNLEKKIEPFLFSSSYSPCQNFKKGK